VHSLVPLHAISQLAKLRSYAIVQNLLDQQATVYSYVDDLRYMAALRFLCAPIVFFVRRVKPKPGAAGALTHAPSFAMPR
jgi:hypothetical protein